jgi:Tol biopolymer transport system component
MLTGSRAFAGDSAASVITAVMSSEPPPVATVRAGVAPALERVVSRLLAKDPNERWQTARDVVAELKWIRDERPQTRGVVTARPLWLALTVTVLLVAMFTALAVVVFWGRRDASPSPRQPIMRFEIDAPPGTTFVPTLTNMALSPDGQYLAFLASRGSETASATRGGALWIRNLESGRTRQLEGTEDARAPFWSPDSRSVGFETIDGTDGTLKKVTLAGGTPETIVNPGGSRFGAAWSVTGTIVFHGALGGGLFRVPSGGGTAVPVTRPDKSRGELSHNWPSFLPDGRHFLFLSVNSKPPALQLWLASIDSDRRTPLLTDVSNTVYVPPGYLLFARQAALFAQPFDVSKNVPIGDVTLLAEQVIRPVFGVPNGGSNVSSSSNGILAYRVPQNEPLQWLDRSCRVVAQLGAPAQYSTPRISPDGTRLAVAKLDISRGTSDLWVFDLQRQAGTSLTTDPGSESEPVWSPDGKRLAYFSNRLGSFELLEKAPDNTKGERSLLTGVMGVHDWSPDGRYIAYHGMDTNTSARPTLLPMRGDAVPWTTLPEASNEQLVNGSLTFSPDGRWIAYQGRESGRWEVYVTTYPSGAGKWLVSTAGGVEPRWRGDGRELIYIASDGSLTSVRISGETTFRSSSPERLCQSPLGGERGPGGGAGTPYDVSRDGQRFVFAYGTNPKALAGPITILGNWPAKLPQLAR